MLVWDNAANGALAAITDVLTGVTSSSFPLVANIARFTILADLRIQLGLYSTTTTQALADQTIKRVSIKKRIFAPTEYKGTAAAITSVQNGALLLLTMGSNSAGVSAGLAVLTIRTTFTDVL
jgi:hypothetical protein